MIFNTSFSDTLFYETILAIVVLF